MVAHGCSRSFDQCLPNLFILLVYCLAQLNFANPTYIDRVILSTSNDIVSSDISLLFHPKREISSSTVQISPHLEIHYLFSPNLDLLDFDPNCTDRETCFDSMYALDEFLNSIIPWDSKLFSVINEMYTFINLTGSNNPNNPRYVHCESCSTNGESINIKEPNSLMSLSNFIILFNFTFLMFAGLYLCIKTRFMISLLYGITVALNIPPSYAYQCTSIPLSLSDVTLCAGSSCTVTTIANVIIPAFDLNSACLIFISPDGVTPSTTFNITIDHAHWVYSPSFEYVSDDPAIAVLSQCGCPLGIKYSNTYCPAYTYISTLSGYSGATVQSGMHSGIDCSTTWANSLSPGTWCTGTSFAINARYQIIGFSSVPVLDVGVIVQSSTDLLVLEYAGTPIGTVGSNNTMNTTILSDTAVAPVNYFCVVFDRASDSDYYLLPYSECNPLNGFNPRLPGYFKYNQTLGIDPLLKVDVTIRSCQNNLWAYAYPWLNTASFLDSNPSLLGKRQSFVSYLINNYFTPLPGDLGLTPSHEFDPYVYLSQGWFFSTYSGAPQAFGIDLYGNKIPTVTSLSVYVGTYSCLCFQAISGGFVSTTITSSTWYISNLGTPTPNGATGASLQWLQPNSTNTPSLYCFRYYDGTNSFCNSISFQGESWPSFQPATFTYNGTFSTSFGPLSYTTPTSFIAENQFGSLTVQVAFTNQKVQFQLPQSASLIVLEQYWDPVGGVATLKIYSATVGGSCVVATVPTGVIGTQIISVGMTSSNQSFQLTGQNFTGVLTFIFQCYQNQISYNFGYIVFNSNQTVQVPVSEYPGGFDYYIPDGKGGYKQGGLNFGDLFSGWWGSGNWYDWIVNILYWISLVIVIILIIIIGLWIFYFIIFKILPRFTWFAKIFATPLNLAMKLTNLLPPSPFAKKKLHKW
jgi:hypothetical protein